MARRSNRVQYKKRFKDGRYNRIRRLELQKALYHTKRHIIDFIMRAKKSTRNKKEWNWRA